MISSIDNEKVITEFQKKNQTLSTVKQLTFLERNELILQGNETLKRPSYHL